MIFVIWGFSFVMALGLIISPWPANLICAALMMLGIGAMTTWGEWWDR